MTRRRLLIVTLLAAVAAVAVIGVLVTIVQHKQEARNPFFRSRWRCFSDSSDRLLSAMCRMRPSGTAASTASM